MRNWKRSSRQDFRFHILFILALLIMSWQGWTLLQGSHSGRPVTGEEEVIFEVTGDSLRLLQSGEINSGRTGSREIADLPQFMRPVFFLPVSINRADPELLQTIPGIGPSRSQAIVEFRKKQGGVSSYTQLLEIKGIGPHTLNHIKEHSTL
ncbi:MAG: ComEA family DNA-binding protein [Desulfurivibrionaceae bacterium]